MADIIIKGMEMPATCWNCKLKVGFSACGLVTDHKDGGFFYRVHNGNSRPDWCPLIPLPAGHGRLIDADAFKAMCLSATKEAKPDFIRNEDWLKSCAITTAFCRDIDEQPTIIEADLEWRMKNCCCFGNTDQKEGGGKDG